MYEIDFTTCTAADVITRSAVCHNSLFAETMEMAARVHEDYARVTTNSTASRVAIGMSANLRRMARDVRLDRLHVASLNCSEMVQAFSVAARLQCLPKYMHAEIVERKPANA